MQAEHQVLEDYERSLAEKAVGSSLCTSSKDSPYLEEKLAFLVEVEDRVSSGKSHFLAGVLKRLFCLVKCL